ncbi:hypothetical protein TTY48_16280 [Tsukamurella sp. TY48]|uniref:GNAT family N-acetyltransferase n=1 Tax=Tsukamurella TaxID=2060 RepID=UPI001C7E15DF|nr:GNAT family N-acetyltransferase [Tsukamurella sp. TY48]GIZ97016.1 hypothetical protein TTY48_16280 [Tsukamurella sp. TY48]
MAAVLQIRSAAPGDEDDLVRLREGLLTSDPQAHWASGPDAPDWIPHYRAQLAAEFADPAAVRTFLATDGDAAVGTLTAIVDHRLAGPSNPTGRAGWVQGVYVAPQARGRGIAARLTAAAEEWFAERGAGAVVLASTPAAEPVYRGLGYLADSETHFRKDLR